MKYPGGPITEKCTLGYIGPPVSTGLLAGYLGLLVTHNHSPEKSGSDHVHAVPDTKEDKAKDVTVVTKIPNTCGRNAITFDKAEVVKHTDESLLVVWTTGVTNITANDNGKSIGYTIDGEGPAYNPKDYGTDTKGKKTIAVGGGGVVIVT